MDALFGGGKAAKRDRSETLGGYTDSRNLFNFALPTAEAGAKTGAATTAAGTNAMGTGLDYWQKLMSGNRATTNQAIAPVANQQASAADAQRKQQSASGTARGGGTAAVNEEAKTKQMSDIDNILFGAQSEGATKVGEVGKSLAQTGTAQTGEAANILGIGANDVANRTTASLDARKQNIANNNSIVNRVTGGLEAALSFFA